MNESNENFFGKNSENLDWIKYSAIEATKEIAKQNEEKYQEFKSRILKFNDITTLEQAKELSRAILPVAKDYNKFRVGDATCVVINRHDVFRVSLDSEKEFISYDFV